MIKKLLRPLYVPLIPLIRKIRYFILPNLMAKKRIFCTSIPNCQQKIFITGKGRVTIGDKCSFGFKLGGRNKYGAIELQPRTIDAHIQIGNSVSTNNNLFICSSNKITIGNNTLIGENVTLMDFEAHGIMPDKRREIGEIGKVIIEKNVWIGNNVTILKNSEIGENSIVAAGAVVNGKFPNNVIIGGVPAKIIKKIDV